MDCPGVLVAAKGRAHVLLMLLGCVMGAFGVSGQATAARFNENLLINGDAEAGPGHNGNALTPVPGWEGTNGVTAVLWGAPDGFPSKSDPGPPDRGLNFLIGGRGIPVGSIHQEFPVADVAEEIDSGLVGLRLSGWIGGFASQTDHATVTAEFRNSAGRAVGAMRIGPVTAADRGNKTSLLFREARGVVPRSTRRVRITLECTRLQGDFNDGYADRMEAELLRLTTPQPAASLSIVRQPVAPAAPVGPGERVTLSVEAVGAGDLGYQWHRNGRLIPGETNAAFNLVLAAVGDLGTYTVVVADDFGSVRSDPVVLRPSINPLVVSDAFPALVGPDGAPPGVNRTLRGSGVADLQGASAEAGEFQHASAGTGRSVWWTWAPGQSGVATLQGIAIDLEPVVAVYLPDPPGSPGIRRLIPVAGSTDLPPAAAGQIWFNVNAGDVFWIALDSPRPLGATDGGRVGLLWGLDVTARRVPEILDVPPERVIGDGGVQRLDATVAPPSGGSVRELEWYRDGVLVVGATQPQLILGAGSEARVGRYYARIQDIFGRAGITLNFTPWIDVQYRVGLPGPGTDVLARDNLARLLQRLGRSNDGGNPARGGGARLAGLGVGTSGTQVFSTSGATTDPGEPLHCGVSSGGTFWYAVQPDANGTLEMDTSGSTFDTVLAVYVDMGHGEGLYDGLQAIACNDDAAANDRTSAVSFCATAGTVYLVAVAGVDGATGIARLSYALERTSVVCRPPVVTCPAIATSRVGSVGRPLTIEARLQGSPPFSIQWLRDGTPVKGAVSTTLFIPSATLADAGAYEVDVTGPGGRVRRLVADVRVAGAGEVATGFELDCAGWVTLQSVGPDRPLAVLESTQDFRTWVPEATNQVVRGAAVFPVPAFLTRPGALLRVRYF